MTTRELHHGDLENCGIPGSECYSSDILSSTEGWVVQDGERIVAIGGITRFWAGVGEAWVISLPGTSAISLHRIARRFIPAISSAMNLHRVHAHCFPEDDHIHRWLKMLGFQSEGLRRGWHFNGRDAHAFAIIFPDNLNQSKLCHT